jgi:LCP family protein required for cell wall assembly
MEKKKNNKSRLIVSLIILVVLCIGGYVLYSTSFFGKELPKFAETPFQGSTPPAGSPIPGQESTSVPSVQQTPSTVSTSGRPICGQREPMFLLGLGIDGSEQADVIRLVRIDLIARKILVLSIPRDLVVPIPGLEEHGVTQNKINASYGYGEYYLGSGQGVVQVSYTLFSNYGVEFDRYAVFHFSNFEDMIDAVGGVDLNLSEAIGAYDVTGPHHFDGAAALDFARMRLADNDIYRSRRQSEVLKALFAKFVQPENITKIPGLGIKFLRDKTMITDVTLKDLLTLACFAGEVNADSLVFREIPADLYSATKTSEGASVLLPDPGLVEYIQDLMITGNY